jgi:hypothetical protein
LLASPTCSSPAAADELDGLENCSSRGSEVEKVGEVVSLSEVKEEANPQN